MASALAWEDQVNHSKMKWTLLVLALAAIAVVSGCKKKEVPAAPAASSRTRAAATSGDSERQP